jgi:hypothetical protein
MRVIAGLACACGLLAASAAAAHHSLALFETDVPVTFQGKVTRVDWRSPHTIIFVEAADPAGPTEWRVETVPNSWLINRAGWTIKYGFLRRVIKADGKVWASPLDIGRRAQREPGQ